jgi:ribosomal protein S12 methylthiotransferase accessory factor
VNWASPHPAAQALQQPVALKTASHIKAEMVDSLATALADLGIARPGDPTAATALTIVLTDDYLHPDLAALNQQQINRQQPWLLVNPWAVCSG